MSSFPRALRRRWVIALVTLLLGQAAGEAQQPAAAPDQWDGVRALIRQTMAASNLPSVAVAVAKEGRILWEEGFGWADVERQLPATPHTMYSLASISKPITATALMRLVEQGRIDLDQPANRYLGAGQLTGLAGDASGATVRRVLSHTAGLPLHYQFYYTNNDYPPASNDETIARYGILVNPPGEVYEYSNLGYGIIDHIIARAAGVDYAEYMQREVFTPLGLTRTSIGIGPGLEAHVAQRYDERRQPIPFYDFDHRGASAVYASAHDLVRFGMFHLKARLPGQGPVLSDATIDLMREPVAPAGYGLGWSVAREPNGSVRLGHSGGMPGVATSLTLFPAEGVAIVVLTNVAGGNLGRISTAIAEVVLPELTEARRQAAQTQSPANTPASFAADPELVGEWTGTLRTWAGTVPMSLVVQSDGVVQAQVDGQAAAALQQASWRNQNLRGFFAGTVPTSDAGRWPHRIALNLRLRGETLSGMVSAQSGNYFALTSFASLTRKAARE